MYFSSIDPKAIPNKKVKFNQDSSARLLFVMGDQISITNTMLSEFSFKHFYVQPLQKDSLYSILSDEFITFGSKYIPKDQFKNDIETYMIKGKPIDFKTVKLIPEFQLYYENNIPQVKITEGADLGIIYNW